MAWLGTILAGAVTVALLSGFWLILGRISPHTARRAWLLAFAVLVGGGITMMDAHAYMAKWAFKGNHPRDGLTAQMDATAAQPFVYRRLAPELVRIVTDAIEPRLPPHTRARLVEESPLKRYLYAYGGSNAWTPRIAVAHHVAYTLMWLAMFGTFLAMAGLLHAVRPSSGLQALVISSLAMCLLPLTLQGGGYLYDAPELFLWTLLLWASLRGPLALVVLLFALLQMNKETALIVTPALFPLLNRRLGVRRATSVSAGLFVLGCAWVAFVRWRFAGLEGAPNEWHLPDNLSFWSTPSNYLLLGQLHAPALLSPRGPNLLVLLFLLVPARLGWQRTEKELRFSAGLIALPLLPMFIVAGNVDETRALALLFPYVFLVTAEGVRALFAEPTQELVPQRATAALAAGAYAATAGPSEPTHPSASSPST